MRQFWLLISLICDGTRLANLQVFLGLLAVIIADGMEPRGSMEAEHGAPVETLITLPENLDPAEGVLHAVWPDIHGAPAVGCPAFTPTLHSW